MAIDCFIKIIRIGESPLGPCQAGGGGRGGPDAKAASGHGTSRALPGSASPPWGPAKPAAAAEAGRTPRLRSVTGRPGPFRARRVPPGALLPPPAPRPPVAAWSLGQPAEEKDKELATISNRKNL